MLWAQVKSRLCSLMRGAEEDGELEEELRFHLEREAEELQRSGATPAEARRRARVALGGYDRVVEETRDARGVAWVENAWRDVRFAARGLWRERRFTLVAVLTLAIGVGATTAVFGLANALLLRPVPGVQAPDQLIVVRLEEGPGLIAGLSHANISDLRAAATSLESMAGYSSRAMQTRTAEAGAFEVQATVVGGDYFGVLGLTPALGRWFTAEELAPGAAGDVVVISHRFWQTHLGGSVDGIGRTIELNAGSYTVVGVAPAGFHGTLRTGSDDVWLPPAAYGRMWHRDVDAGDRRTSMFDELVGRLAPGATAARAEQQLGAAMARLVEAYPDANGHLETYDLRVYEGIGLEVSARASTRRTVALLLGIVCVLLLIACANVANLLLARGVARSGETALRTALGASRGRLLQQNLAEGLLLSTIGAAAGIVVAVALGRLFAGQRLPDLPAIGSLTPDWRVIAFAGGCALLTGVIFTLLPTLSAMRRAGSGMLRRSARSVTDPGSSLRSALTTLQIAASLTLLVGALMLVRTVLALDRVDIGIDPERVSVFGVSPAQQGYAVEETRTFRRRLLEEVSTRPGIGMASIASLGPYGSDRMLFRLSVPGVAAEPVRVATNEVSADWFEVVGTDIIAGRGFDDAEQFATLEDGPGIVLNRMAARRLFGDADPVGRLIEVAGFTGTTRQIVIGVVEDVRATPRSEPAPEAYVPIGSSSIQSAYVVVRSDLPFERTRELIAGTVARLDPNIPFFTAEPLSAAVRRAAAEERLLARLLGVFAVLAVLLASIGLYGVISYSVARRRREIGIRMALGARPRSVVRMVVDRSLQLVLAGSLAGVLGGYALARILDSRMFGVTPIDPATYALAVATFALVAFLASAPSAIAAVRIDPVKTLRDE